MFHSDELNPMTFWKDEFEADGRDFKVENILGEPTQEELEENIGKDISLLPNIQKTTYQNGWGSCTAASLANVAIIQNTTDYGTLDVFAEREDLRTKMGHKLGDKSDSGDYLENALKAMTKDGVNGMVKGKNVNFKLDGYAYKSIGTSDIDVLKMKYYIDKGYPLYIAFRGDSAVWKQMRVGNLERVISRGEATGGHALAIIGVVNIEGIRYIQVINSWKPVNGELSYFIMKLDDFKRAIKVDMVSRRYWITYDKKDVTAEKLFDDFYAEEDSEEYKAISWMKDMGYYQGYKGKVFPEKPLTRKEFALVMYRMSNTPKAATPSKFEGDMDTGVEITTSSKKKKLLSKKRTTWE